MTWTLQVIEADGTAVGDPLAVAPGGSITMSLPEGATNPNRLVDITLLDPLPDMRGRLLRDHWAGDTGPGEVWVPQRPSSQRLTTASSSRTISALDVTALLSRVMLPRGEVMPAGHGVVEWCSELLGRYLPVLDERSRFRVVDVDTSVRSELAFAPGTSLLTATTDPLLAAAMTPWLPGPAGLVTSSPWMPASQRPVAEVFGDDTAPPDASGFYDGWDADPDDIAPLPNEVLAIVRASGDLPEIVGRWADEADIYATGLRTEIVPGTVEATDQAAADRIAAKRAEEHVRRRPTCTFSGPWRPIRPGQIARIVWAAHGIDRRVELVTKRTERNAAADTSYTVRAV